MTNGFLSKIAARIVGTKGTGLDWIPTADCEKLAGWALSNFEFKPRVAYLPKGGWFRSNLDGQVLMYREMTYWDRMGRGEKRGYFSLLLDHTGFPVKADAIAWNFASKADLHMNRPTSIERMGTQPDFGMISSIRSIHELNTIRVPEVMATPQMREIAEWALDNMEIGSARSANPTGSWSVENHVGGLVLRHDVTFDFDGATRLKGAFKVEFDGDGEPHGAWATIQQRTPFAIRTPEEFEVSTSYAAKIRAHTQSRPAL
ncbi:hypothetical protein [Rhizobium sp. BK176]|uniref:hypothetical protein n=1 Tax=Rhizobium sp. BK176 TaxID=2587071 RepID=UPI002166DEA5|nr:hypothetical protein [Rhizobium sp. BK176]MCS4088938.1 hypothetical protein [Rhizobium sp. BK176]